MILSKSLLKSLWNYIIIFIYKNKGKVEFVEYYYGFKKWLYHFTNHVSKSLLRKKQWEEAIIFGTFFLGGY